MDKNKHLIMRIESVKKIELLKYTDILEKYMDNIMSTMKFKIVNRCKHQFEPFGATMIYLLAESHCSFHTFWEQKRVYIDLFSCMPFDHDKMISLLLNIFDSTEYYSRIIYRDD